MKPGLPERLQRLTAEALQRAGLASRGARLVVAVSGGPDSMALLHILLALRDSLSVQLHVAHLDHDFRGQEAVEDARFVAAQARTLGLPATIGKEDPVAYKATHHISSMEEALRRVRYAFLARVARDTGADAVALGHTADDQAETVLLHILRGAGLHGLRGMEPLSTLRLPEEGVELTLVRPLLEATREETRAYCHACKVPFRDDTTNRSMRFARNRVRFQLMPALRSYNPRVREALVRLARAAGQEAAYLESQAKAHYQVVVSEEGDTLVLLTNGLLGLAPTVGTQLLRCAYARLTGSTAALTERHLVAMAGLANAPPGKRLHLPKGVVLQVEYGRLRMGRNLVATCPLPSLEGERPLAVPGETRLPGWLVRVELLDAPPTPLPDGVHAACFDLDVVGNRVWVRTRYPGDRFQPLGMTEPKKLQDFLVEEKVPRAWRDRVPLVVGERGIAWVVGYRIAHWARVNEKTRRVLTVEFTRA